jgi:hypothetical protein
MLNVPGYALDKGVSLIDWGFIWGIHDCYLFVGINEHRKNDRAFIYPNPATTELWLQLPENMPFAQVQIELYCPTGRLLYKAKPASRFHKIETAQLQPGFYMVRVWNGKQWFGEKVVVKSF